VTLRLTWQDFRQIAALIASLYHLYPPSLSFRTKRWCYMYKKLQIITRVRGVAMKFPEGFYCKHTCVLTAYWEESPSKYSPSAAVHLAQRCCHCWKHFQCRWHISFLGCLQYPKVFVPLKQTFFLKVARSNSRKNQGNRVGVHFQ